MGHRALAVGVVLCPRRATKSAALTSQRTKTTARRGGWRWEFKDTCSLLGFGNFDDQTVQGVRRTRAMSASLSLLFLPHPCRPAPAAILGRATQGCAAQGPVLAQGSHQTGKGSRSRARRSAAGARSTLEIGEKISRSGRAGSLAAAHRHAEKSRSAGGFRGARRSRIARAVDRRSKG